LEGKIGEKITLRELYGGEETEMCPADNKKRRHSKIKRKKEKKGAEIMIVKKK